MSNSDTLGVELTPTEHKDETYIPQNAYAERLTPQQRAKKSALAAKTKRWMLKREGQEIIEDHRTPQEMALDNLSEICENNEWVYSFDKESLSLLVRKDRLAFSANLEPGGSGVEECFFMRQCASLESLFMAIDQSFDFQRPDLEQAAEAISEDEIEDQYEQVIERSVLGLWDIQGDSKDPDKLMLGKGQELITVKWNDEGVLKASIGYRISSLMTLFKLVQEYGPNGDKSHIN